MSAAFETAFLRTVGIEGGYSLDPDDDGNWTGGAKGKGTLKGTKYGISAASYPTLDIANITLEEAKRIYLRDFWDVMGCDELPTALAIQMFDAGVNHGSDNALRIMQAALGVSPDGKIGPVTKTAIAAALIRQETLLMRFLAHRLMFWTGRAKWPRFGAGWTNRGAKQLLGAADDVEGRP